VVWNVNHSLPPLSHFVSTDLTLGRGKCAIPSGQKLRLIILIEELCCGALWLVWAGDECYSKCTYCYIFLMTCVLQFIF
jgi:hypothetical protein